MAFIYILAESYVEATRLAREMGYSPRGVFIITEHNLPHGVHNIEIHCYGDYLNTLRRGTGIIEAVLQTIGVIYILHMRRHPSQTTAHTGGTAMPIKARIWWDDQAQAYVISSSYNDKLVAALKNLIPSGERNYDPATKFWYVKEKWGDVIRDIASSAFGIHSVSFTSKTVAQQAQQQQQAYQRPVTTYQGTTEGALLEFFNLLSYNAAKRAYLFASQELHPDKPTGDAGKMAKLNELWTRIEKEFFKK